MKVYSSNITIEAFIARHIGICDLASDNYPRRRVMRNPK
jgi:hypothetical protein